METRDAAAVPELHAAIMKIPCAVPNHNGIPYDFAMAYRTGHRDGRHAAAELAASLPASQAAPQGVEYRPVGKFLYVGIGYGSFRPCRTASGKRSVKCGWHIEVNTPLGWRALTYGALYETREEATIARTIVEATVPEREFPIYEAVWGRV